MAQFQKNIYHKDTIEKRPITLEDLQFLQNLQKELNTQDNMGNADPEFWVIQQSHTEPAPPDYADGSMLYDDDTEIAANTKAALDYIEAEKNNIFPENTSITIQRMKDENYGFISIIHVTTKKITMPYLIRNLYDIKSCLNETAKHDNYHIEDYIVISEIVPDTMFLTHKACEEHLRKYSYNYRPDAHAYAMTAYRSPEYEKLLDIIRHTNFDELKEGIK